MFARQSNGVCDSMSRCELILKLPLKVQCERTASFVEKASAWVTLISQVNYRYVHH